MHGSLWEMPEALISGSAQALFVDQENGVTLRLLVKNERDEYDSCNRRHQLV